MKRSPKPTDLIGTNGIESWDRCNQVVGVITKKGDMILEETLTNKVIAHIPAALLQDADRVITSLMEDDST